jgi:hypothetical protein
MNEPLTNEDYQRLDRLCEFLLAVQNRNTPFEVRLWHYRINDRLEFAWVNCQ